MTIMRANNQTFSGNDKNLLIIGDGNTVTGMNCAVHGNRNVLVGMRITVTGNYNTLAGVECTAIGDYNKLPGVRCQAIGDHNLFSGIDGISRGNYNTGSTTASVRSANGHALNISKNVPIDQHGNFMIPNLTAGITTHVASRMLPEPQYVKGPPLSDVTHDYKPDNGNNKTCVICLENAPICIAMPCFHLSYCVKCARRLCFGQNGTDTKERGTVKCACCNLPVDEFKRIYQD